jgi:hypothetical protein
MKFAPKFDTKSKRFAAKPAVTAQSRIDVRAFGQGSVFLEAKAARGEVEAKA